MPLNNLLGLILLLVSNLSLAAFELPKVEHYRLENGLHVYLLHDDDVPLVDIRVAIRAGAVNDDVAGLAQLTAENLLLGTLKTPKATLEQQLDFIGADMAIEADLESTLLSLSLAAKDLPEVLKLVAEIVQTPAFDENEFSAHKERYLSQLKQKRDSARGVIRDYFDQWVYAKHPYAELTDGSQTSVASINAKQLQAFHQIWYVPSNAALIVSGDFEKVALKRQITAQFARWQGNPVTSGEIAPPKPPKQARVLLVNKADTNESSFMLGGLGPELSHPDSFGLDVINTLLGGRFTSWLNDALRVESGLTYGAGSRFDQHRQGGTFAVSSYTETATTIEAIDLALSTYAKLWQPGVDQATLASAKAYVKGQFPPQFETAGQRANLLAQMFLYGLPANYLEQFLHSVEGLDTDAAKRLINQHFPKANLQMVVIGQADALRESLQKYGEVTEVDIQQAVLD